MTLTELKKQLEETGYPVAYNVFKKAQKPPYICYFITDSDNLYADGKVYSKVDNVQIELYTTNKDIKAEEKLEEVLSEFKYQTGESLLEDENIYLKIYEIQI